MSSSPEPRPRLRFVSLFVPNLDEAAHQYEVALGVRASDAAHCVPIAHPFSRRTPVVFLLGDVALVLYECDGRTTHAGDVGLGLEESPRAFSERAARAGGRTFWGPRPLPGDGPEMCITLLPTHHFFEVVAPQTSQEEVVAARSENSEGDREVHQGG